MRRLIPFLAFALALAVSHGSSLAHAEELEGGSPTGAAPASEGRDWEIEVAPYLWVSMVDGKIETARFGKQHIKADIDDVLKAFDVGFMGQAGARWKRFLFLSDFNWTRLSDRDNVGGGLVRYELEQEIAWLELLGGYRLLQKGGGLLGGEAEATRGRSFDVDGFVGLVYTSIDNKLDLRSDPLAQIPPQERTVRERNDWVAPYLALRLRNDFTDRLEVETLVGVGGFGAGDAPDVSWQASLTLSYAITQHVRLNAGYRGQGFEKQNLEIAFHGPVLGAALRY